MKLFSQLLVLGLAAEGAIASNWFSKAGMFEAFLQFSTPRRHCGNISELHEASLFAFGLLFSFPSNFRNRSTTSYHLPITSFHTFLPT
jgi:hypothetical protein